MLTAQEEILIKFFQVLKLRLKLILNIRIVTSHQGIPKILCVCLKGFVVNLITLAIEIKLYEQRRCSGVSLHKRMHLPYG